VIRKVEHVAFKVRDMDASVAFFSSVFGFKTRTRGANDVFEMAFLYHAGMPGFELELIRDLLPGQVYAEQGIVNHLAFTVDDIGEAMRHYGALGVPFAAKEPSTALDGGKTIFFFGPNRELLQFVEPPAHRKLALRQG
jgi:lactoylglutathione lyase